MEVQCCSQNKTRDTQIILRLMRIIIIIIIFSKSAEEKHLCSWPKHTFGLLSETKD